mmetsp:Transcript_25278/g.54649  ORF Transcript_25278/g.54649 Transcript_25278/m.54649 type:complete len:188 (+) Transcript_25278:934-1497(+)
MVNSAQRLVGVPGVFLHEAVVPNARALFKCVSSGVDWDERMRARRTASFGVPYNYSGMSYAECPLPEFLLPLCGAVKELTHWEPNSCLINYYLDGSSSLGFHSDQTEIMVPGTGVAIASLGAARSICFRSKHATPEVRVMYTLCEGTLLLMDQECQHEWVHGIPKEPAGAEARISLTFRRLLRAPQP